MIAIIVFCLYCVGLRKAIYLRESIAEFGRWICPASQIEFSVGTTGFLYSQIGFSRGTADR